MDVHLIWESVKAPLRQVLLFAYAYILNWLFGFIFRTVGFEFSEEQKLEIMGFGTPIVWSILSFIDKYMHEVGKARDEESTARVQAESPLTRGITIF